MHFATVSQNRRVVVAALYVMFFLLAGCKDPLETTLPNAGNNTTQQKSYLTFKNFDEFYQTIDKLNKQSDVQQKAWDESQGFISLRQLFNRVVEEEASAYEQEDKLSLINPKNHPSHLQSKTAVTLGEMIIYDQENGGVVLNLANPMMAAVLNKQGVVCVDNTFYQFSYDAVKSTPKKSDANSEQCIRAMANTQVSDKAEQIAVNAIRHKLKAIDTPQARTGYAHPFSCESASGNPYEWKMIAYIDESVSEWTEWRADYNYNTYNSYGYTPYTAVPHVDAVAQICVRTLKRGFWGDWYDRDTQQQTLSGSIKIDPTAPGVNGAVSAVQTDFPGNSFTNGVGMSGYGFTTSVNFVMNGPDSQRSSWNINVYRYSSLGYNYTNNQRIINNGSVFRFGWSGYNCNCDVFF